MFPSAGLIHLAPFTDEGLYAETLGKVCDALLWYRIGRTNPSFLCQASFFNHELYGIDMSALAYSAAEEVFAQPVVGLFPPSQLVASGTAQHLIDFYTVTQEVGLSLSGTTDMR